MIPEKIQNIKNYLLEKSEVAVSGKMLSEMFDNPDVKMFLAYDPLDVLVKDFTRDLNRLTIFLNASCEEKREQGIFVFYSLA